MAIEGQTSPKTYEEMLGITAERLASPEYFPPVDDIDWVSLHTTYSRLKQLGMLQGGAAQLDNVNALRGLLRENGVTGIGHTSTLLKPYSTNENTPIVFIPWLISPEDVLVHAHNHYGHDAPSAELLSLLPDGIAVDPFSTLGAYTVAVEGIRPLMLIDKFHLGTPEAEAIERASKLLSMARFCVFSGHDGINIQSWPDPLQPTQKPV